MENELKQQFDELGIEPTTEVMAKSLELCDEYHIDDAVEFVEQWIAFSLSHLNGDEPTTANLIEFERKVFHAKRDKELAFGSKKKTKVVKNPASAVRHTDVLHVDEYMDEAGGEDGLLDAYNVPHTPKTNRAVARTPARPNDALFSPASYSPIGTPRSHNATAGSGKIVYTFGNPKLISAAQWTSVLEQPSPPIHVRQLLQHNGETLSAVKSKYMFDNLREKAEIAGDRVFHIGKSLCHKVFGAQADDYELSQVDVHSQDTMKTIGTIHCDHDGPLDASSTLLVGSDEARCRTVRLNFARAKSVAVFPGQVAIVSGMNPKGDMFVVDEVLAERQLEPPAPPRFANQLSFVIAAGPFTHDDDLVYEPLHDLCTYLKSHRPDVLILAGPFLEADHKLISENLTLAETFDSFFEKMIAGIVEAIGPSTTVLVVSSQNDANADPVYPTMPLTLKKTYANVHMLPDPSLVDVNGIVIGMTSTDVVDHLLSHELAVNAGDKVKRVVNYLLHQGSFYPLNPPVEDKMCFDSTLAAKYANLEQIPNILILPSDQKCFIRVVNGCLAINPGRLADKTGGTFARFIIQPPAAKDESNLFNYLACQVRKV